MRVTGTVIISSLQGFVKALYDLPSEVVAQSVMIVEGSPQVGIHFPSVTCSLAARLFRPNVLTIDSSLLLSQKS